MPKVLIKGKNMYYEIYGEGEPLVILNGIMMSTGSWSSFVDVLSNRNKLVLVDFIDQGQSDKVEDQYSQDLHVEMLHDLFDQLNLGKLHLLGVSYGGEVAQRFALKYQEQLLSLVLANTTSYTNHILKDMHQFICFIVLNQLNDNFILRKDNIKTQRPLESDVYGSGQLLKLCDVLYIKLDDF